MGALYEDIPFCNAQIRVKKKQMQAGGPSVAEWSNK